MINTGRNKLEIRTDRVSTLLSSATIYFTITSILWLLLYNDINLRKSFNDRAIGITVLMGIDATARTKLYVGLIIISIVGFVIFKYAYNLSLVKLLNRSHFNLWHKSLFMGLIFLLIGGGSIALDKWLHVVTGESLSNLIKALLPALLTFNILLIMAVMIVLTGMSFHYRWIIYRLKHFAGLHFLYVIMAMISVSVLCFVFGITELLISLKILLILFALSGSIGVAKYWCLRNHKAKFINILSDHNIIVFCLIMPIVVIITQSALFSSEFIVSDTKLVEYPIISLICFLFCFYIMKREIENGISQRMISDSLVMAGIFFLLIPPAIPVINELQYSMSSKVNIHIWHLITAFILICALTGIIIPILFMKKSMQPLNSKNIIYYIYYPILLATLVIYKFRQTTLVFNNYDMFHHGEMLITNQQLFSFGSIPLVDSYPTHGMSDTFYQILYSMINGYRYVEPLLWSWLPKMFGIVLLYLLLSKIIDHDFSIIIIVFTPLIAIFGNSTSDFYYYCTLFLPALTLYWMLQKMSFFRQSIHWLTIVFLLLYRVEFGVLALISSVMIIGMYQYRCCLNNDWKLKEMRNTIISFSIVFSVLFLLIALIIKLEGESIHSIVAQNLILLTFQDSTMSYASIIPNSKLVTLILAFIQYVILPSISIFYIIFFISEFLSKRKIPSNVSLMMLFLASLSLMISVRSLQRHSLIEGYNGYLFIFIALCAPTSIFSWKKIDSSMMFVGLLTIFIIFMLPLNPLMHNAVASQSIIPADNSNYLSIHDWTTKESRLVENQSQYKNTVSFITTVTNKNQTFFDFTNSPILYIFSDKKDLLYIIPNLYQSSDTLQNIYLNKLKAAYDQNDIPIVIFKQGNSWDCVDGVPNEVRSYLITEFIYLSYVPLGCIDNYQIWVSKKSNFSFNSNNNLNSSITIDQHFNLMKLPYIWGKYDPKNACKTTAVLENVNDTIITINELGNIISFNPNIDKSSGNYLQLSIKSNCTANVQLVYGSSPNASITFNTVPSNDYQDYLIRISTQWVWMNQSIDKFTLSADQPVSINKIIIRKGD